MLGVLVRGERGHIEGPELELDRLALLRRRDLAVGAGLDRVREGDLNLGLGLDADDGHAVVVRDPLEDDARHVDLEWVGRRPAEDLVGGRGRSSGSAATPRSRTGSPPG
jgi:hypothetical protein